MAETSRRRAMIRRIVASRSVSTQAELVGLLSHSGVAATQASVSRDIAALGLVKVGGRYAQPQAAAPLGSLRKKIEGRIHRLALAGDNLIVLFTDPGEASIVALAIDAARWPTVVGTLAGDDTLFLACDGKAEQEKTLKALRALTPESFSEDQQE